jgi:hypothetical protein
MQASEFLSQIAIPTRCTQNWNSMQGSEQTKFCSTCHKQVHNLAAMTSEEIATLFREGEGEICGRIFRRPDGTVVTADCPPPAAPRRLWQLSLRSLVGIVTACAAGLGIGRVVPKEWLLPSPAPKRPLTVQTSEMMGMMMLPTPSAPAAAGSAVEGAETAACEAIDISQ